MSCVCSSGVSSLPVKTTTGTSARAGSACIFSSNSKPVMSGSRRSSTTQSNDAVEHRFKASAPVAAVQHLDVVVSEQLDDGLPLDVVVLDDQQPFGARGGEVLDAVESRFQALGRGRLDEVGEGAVRQAVLALLFQRDDLHRDVARGRVELELVEHGPAEHVGQEDIERDGRGAELPGQGKTDRALGGDDAFEALVARQTQQDAGVVRIVLDDQQHQVAVLDGIAVVLDVLLAGHRQDREFARPGRGPEAGASPAAVGTGVVERQVEGEGAALPMDAGELDFAAEQHGQFAADGQSQAGAAVFAARCRRRPAGTPRRSCRCFSGAMPMPVSSTAKATTWPALLSTG